MFVYFLIISKWQQIKCKYFKFYVYPVMQPLNHHQQTASVEERRHSRTRIRIISRGRWGREREFLLWGTLCGGVLCSPSIHHHITSQSHRPSKSQPSSSSSYKMLLHKKWFTKQLLLLLVVGSMPSNSSPEEEQSEWRDTNYMCDGVPLPDSFFFLLHRQQQQTHQGGPALLGLASLPGDEKNIETTNGKPPP